MVVFLAHSVLQVSRMEKTGLFEKLRAKSPSVTRRRTARGSDGGIIDALHAAGGPTTASELADRLQCSLIEVAGALRRLANEGRVYRVPGERAAWAPAVAHDAEISELVDIVAQLIYEGAGGDAHTLRELCQITGQPRGKISDCLTRIQEESGAIKIPTRESANPNDSRYNAYLIPADESEREKARTEYATKSKRERTKSKIRAPKAADPARYCQRCGKVLTKRDDERPARFRNRQTCGRHC